MTNQRERLFAKLLDLGIETSTIEHPPVYTVAESDRIECQLLGGHTKNLFLKDAKGRLFLVVAESQTLVDLKALPATLGCKRLSFGSATLLKEILEVTPGSVTAFAVLADADGRVEVVIDRLLTQFDTVNCHPMTNTATTNIALKDLLRFIEATGHPYVIADLGPNSGQGQT